MGPRSALNRMRKPTNVVPAHSRVSGVNVSDAAGKGSIAGFVFVVALSCRTFSGCLTPFRDAWSANLARRNRNAAPRSFSISCRTFSCTAGFSFRSRSSSTFNSAEESLLSTGGSTFVGMVSCARDAKGDTRASMRMTEYTSDIRVCCVPLPVVSFLSQFELGVLAAGIGT